jgi:fermentation-respiration switch protein FrsA (DUF1100 family)
VLPGAEELEISTTDGLRLGAWFAPPTEGQARATVVVFNGNAGNRSFRAPLAARLTQSGLAVLLVDYRGFGGNSGKPSEQGLIADARAVRTYLESRPDVDPNRLVYFGESLGSGVAVALATEQPPAALVLRSPFASLTDLGRMHYPFLPVSLLLKDRFSSIERIDRVRCPLLIIAGDRDRIVPLTQSRKLFDAASMERKRLLIIEGVGHNDWELLAGDELIEAVVTFIDRQMPPAAAK